MTESRISPELFSDAAYKTARKELNVFNKVISNLFSFHFITQSDFFFEF